MIVIGIDPGTGVSSPTGFAAFDPDTKEVLYVEAIGSNKATPAGRIREISQRVAELLESVDPDADALVAIESFVMRGKGGETLARMTGALMAAIPERMDQVFVQNTTVKLLVGGHGKADKDQVAAGALHWLYGSGAAQNAAFELYSRDETDALAIGIAGWLKTKTNPGQPSTSSAPRKKRSSSRSKTSSK